MHDALQSDRRPEDPPEDSLRLEALPVSALQRQLQRPKQFECAHAQAHGQWGAFTQGNGAL